MPGDSNPGLFLSAARIIRYAKRTQLKNDQPPAPLEVGRNRVWVRMGAFVQQKGRSGPFSAVPGKRIGRGVSLARGCRPVRVEMRVEAVQHAGDLWRGGGGDGGGGGA